MMKKIAVDVWPNPHTFMDSYKIIIRNLFCNIVGGGRIIGPRKHLSSNAGLLPEVIGKFSIADTYNVYIL